MRDFLNKLRESHLRFMRNRYGGDQLGLVIVSLSLVCTIITWLTHWRWLSVVSLAALAFELWRMYSRDIPARAEPKGQQELSGKGDRSLTRLWKARGHPGRTRRQSRSGGPRAPKRQSARGAENLSGQITEARFIWHG